MRETHKAINESNPRASISQDTFSPLKLRFDVCKKISSGNMRNQHISKKRKHDFQAIFFFRNFISVFDLLVFVWFGSMVTMTNYRELEIFMLPETEEIFINIFSRSHTKTAKHKRNRFFMIPLYD